MPTPFVFLILFALLPAAAVAEDGGLPDPLSLEQALDLAGQAPFGRASGALSGMLPRRRPLYLDCHHLAFSQAAADDDRSQPLEGLIAPRDAQGLEIMARFFDVLLADLGFARYNEAMAVAYIQYDRANVRQELGQFSELRVAELEAVYQDVRRKRASSQIAQRLTRSLLAQAVGRPDQLPRDLSQPQLPQIPDPLPEPEEAVAAALANNGRLTELKQGADEGDLNLLDAALRQQALELLLRLDGLSAAEQHANVELTLSDLKLDESRTLYEQEVKADLGFSMSRQTRARLEQQRVAFCRALTWAELNALQGKPLWPQPEAEAQP